MAVTFQKATLKTALYSLISAFCQAKIHFYIHFSDRNIYQYNCIKCQILVFFMQLVMALEPKIGNICKILFFLRNTTGVNP